MTNRIALLAVLVALFPIPSLFSQTDTISGRVVATDGTPMAGIPVKARQDGSNSEDVPTITTKTDNDGRYMFEGVPYGTYTIHAEPDGGNGTTLHANIIVRIPFPDSAPDLAIGDRTLPTARPTMIPIVNGPARLTVPDKETARFDLVVLPSAFTVGGQLVVPEGMTLPTQIASLSSSTSQQIGTDTYTTSQLTLNTEVRSDGKFEISKVPPGAYVLRIVPNLGISPRTITVTDHNQNDIELGGKGSGVRVSAVFQNHSPRRFHNHSPAPGESVSFSNSI